MQNEMRDRLVELIDDFVHYENVNDLKSDECKEGLADYLIEEGNVIVPPCKVGDTVYYNLGKNASLPFGTKRTLALEVEAIASTKDKKDWFVRTMFAGAIGDFNFSDFGKTVFLTKEEAEKY